VAIAVAENSKLVQKFFSGSTDDATTMELHALRAVLRDVPDALLAELLRDGTGASIWSRVEERVRTLHVLSVLRLAMAMKEDADRKMAELKKKPAQVLRASAEEYAQQAAYLRSIDTRPGADGPEKRMAEVLEGQRHVALMAATKGRHKLPTPRPELSVELDADRLCLETVAPWLDLDVVEKEKRLREAVRVCPWSSYARRRLGSHLSERGRAEEAITQLREAVKLNPKNVEGRTGLAYVLLDREWYDEAMAVTAVDVASPELATIRAYCTLKLGDAETAESIVRGVLLDVPRHTTALRVLAACLRGLGNEKRAKELERDAAFYERGVRPPGG
jgi:tetratricopeptide (TPR) repeat protein